MLQTLERTSRDAHDTIATAGSLKAAVRRTEQDDGLLAEAGPIMMAAYAVALMVAVLTFKGSVEALFAVAISIGFAVMFFAVPLLLLRVRTRHDVRWQKRERGSNDEVDTFTGILSRSEAVLHMLIVPLAASSAFMAFAVIWVLVRP